MTKLIVPKFIARFIVVVLTLTNCIEITYSQVNFCATANNAGNVSGTSCATAGFN